MTDKLTQQLQFLMEADKMKTVLRQTLLSDKSRAETDAEHSWHIALMAMTLYEHCGLKDVHLDRVIQMTLVHDLVEIYAGDTFAYDVKGYESKETREKEAADKLFSLLPQEQAHEFRVLWEEFDCMETPDSLYASAIDRLQPFMSNYLTDGHTWVKHGVTVDKVYKRMEPIKAALPECWEFVEKVIQDSVEKGYIKLEDHFNPVSIKTKEVDMKEFLRQAAQVKPSQRQISWFNTEFYAFIHFGVNTFTNQEWGMGDEAEALFNPTKLDCTQWVRSIKAAGCKGLVLTAKHHDGFCLWPSKFTEHSVKNSPFKGDVVKLAADACKQEGIKFGFYLSPWDRNSKYYGTDEYNNYFCNQLTELLTEYGEIFYVWFDGACGEGENGKKQVYDFQRYIELIRKYQPNAVIFNDAGPDVRWCGNESGSARYAEWAVVPNELCHRAEVQTNAGPMVEEGNLSFLYNTDESIGSLSNILYSRGLSFCPSEVDMSIRPGWFWHPEEEPHSLKRLYDTYLKSVGANACLHLNVPPTKEGLLDERDVKRLEELGALINKEFSNSVPAVVNTDSTYPTQPAYEITFDEARNDLKYIVLKENIAKGQRVESFSISGEFYDGQKFPMYQGTCIGHKKICPLCDPFANQPPLIGTSRNKIKKVIVKIKASRGPVDLSEINIYA